MSSIQWPNNNFLNFPQPYGYLYNFELRLHSKRLYLDIEHVKTLRKSYTWYLYHILLN
jgi:hypothetical protein